jgi:anti-sigma B factor antagonist
MAESFQAHVRFQDGLPVIDLVGEVNASAEEDLTAAHREASSNGATSLLLNFADMTFMNSTGIALIVSLLAQARKSHQKVLVCGLNDHYRQIFQITRLADFMTLHDDEASAVAQAAAATR